MQHIIISAKAHVTKPRGLVSGLIEHSSPQTIRHIQNVVAQQKFVLIIISVNEASKVVNSIYYAINVSSVMNPKYSPFRHSVFGRALAAILRTRERHLVDAHRNEEDYLLSLRAKFAFFLPLNSREHLFCQYTTERKTSARTEKYFLESPSPRTHPANGESRRESPFERSAMRKMSSSVASTTLSRADVRLSTF